MSEIVTQTKLVLPGSQIKYYNLADVNDKYFVYCSTFSVFVFNKSDFKLRSILGEKSDKFISAIALNYSTSEELLSIYYGQEILIYNLYTNKYSYSIPFTGLKKMKFNHNSNLIILNEKGELYISKVDYNDIQYINKIKIDEGMCNCFNWYPFNANDFAYSTDKNKVYYHSLNKNNANIDNNSLIDNIKGKNKIKNIHIKDDEHFSISAMEFYDLDENYKYLLVGTTNGKIYLLDFINYEILSKFNKYGKTPVQYLFWLGNQPGSFISISDKAGRYIKWNVSRFNYTLIGKISDFNLTSCAKFDNNSNFLVTNGNGEVTVIDIINSKNSFQIKDRHNQCIYDLKINPNNDDLFITGSYDGNIKLYSIKNNYKLIYNFNTNNLNNLKSAKDNNSGIRTGINNNLNNSDKNHIISLKWSPNNSNLFISGDSNLCLRIFDISLKKQVIVYKCNVNNKTHNGKNVLIHGIDWNKNNNIIVGVNITVFIFSFVINNNSNKNNEKYCLSLIKEFNINSLVYNLTFGPNNENVIAPCDDGNIYFYDTTKDELGKITDINSSSSKTITGHKKGVYQVIFNRTNNIMVSSSDDMTIGLYDYENSLSTPRSKPASVITKFLTGQENPIRQMAFLDNDILISGSWGGVICIWKIEKCQLIYKISENQSDVYGISCLKKHPYSFITGGRDNIIRFWNLNYKYNLSELLEINKNNKKEIENFINKYFFEENIDKFFQIFSNQNKEKELIDSIILEEDLIKKDYSKYNLNDNDLGINNKLDFSIKQYDKDFVIDNLIKESAIIGEWKLLCELCIAKNRWEDAICFAPKVSLDYWQSLMNKYESFISSEDYMSNKSIKQNYNNSEFDDIKLVGLLNGKNYKEIIDSCIKQKDFQNALMIWLMKKSKNGSNENKNKNINECNNIINIEVNSGISSLLNEIDINNVGQNIRKNLNEDDNIKKLFDEESLVLLKEGKRLKAIMNYMYIDDKFILFKTIYKSYFIELGYLMCNIEELGNKDDLKKINDLYILLIYEKFKTKINDNNISQLINKLYDEDYKNIFYHKLQNKDNDGVLNISQNINKSELITIIESNETSLCVELINKYKKECFNKLSNLFLDKENKIDINESELNEISLKLSEYQKFLILLKIDEKQIQPQILNDIIYSVMFFECLNYNYKSLICLTIEYFISKNIIDIKKESNNNLLIFIFNFINHIQNDFKDNETVKQYKFNYIHQQKYGLISSIFNQNLLNPNKFDKVRNILKFNDFYKCNVNEMKLFYLQNEIYPKKVNNNDNLSSFSNNNIKSNIIRLMSGNYCSQSEYLEMSKFLFLK